MVRKLNIVVAPARSLVAFSGLAALAMDARDDRWPGALGDRLRREVARAGAKLHRPLARMDACLRWLVAHGHGALRPLDERPSRRAPAWLATVSLAVDLRALAEQLSDDDGDAEGDGHVAAWALRAVLREAARAGLWEVASVRAGSQRGTVEGALAALDEALADADAALPERMPDALDDAPAKPPKTAKATKVRVEPEPEPQPEPVKESRPKESRRADAKPEGTREKRAKSAKRAASFGGLPDDAEPEDRRATEPAEPLGPRGLTIDAEFFLEQGGVEAWPCDLATLERARKRAIARLHPDRAGEASTTAFHRAIKGHAQALAKLEALLASGQAATATTTAPTTVTTPTTTTPPATTPAPTATKPTPVVKPAATKPAVPVTPVPPVAPVVTAPVRPVARAVPPPQPSTVCEWPPPPPPPVTAVKPAVSVAGAVGRRRVANA